MFKALAASPFLRIIVFLALSQELLSSCVPWPTGLERGDVRVIVEPFGEGDEISSRAPVLYLHPPIRPICRPSPVNVRTLRRLISEAGFDLNSDGGLGDALGLREVEEEAGEEAAAGLSEEERERRRQPVLAGGVGAQWIKFGLYISNEKNFSGNERSKRHLPLFVTGLHFNATARVGNQRFSHRADIGPDYCEGQLFYLVFGGKAVKYQPNSQNPLHNLTLYLSNFPVYDRRGEEEEEAPQAAEGREAVAAAAAASGAAGTASSIAGDCVVYIPRYKIKLTVTGYFMTEKGNIAEDFFHQTVFHTTAVNNC